MWMFSNGRKAKHMTEGELITSAADNGGMGVTPDSARGHDHPAHRGFMGAVMHLLGRS